MQERTERTPGMRGGDPAEGRSDLGLPGADRPDQLDDRHPGGGPNPGHTPDPQQPPPDREPPDPGADLPQRLGERIENGPGSGSGIAAGEPDLLPNVDVPEETM